MDQNKFEEPQGTDRTRLIKGFKFLAGSLVLAFLGPSIVYSAFGNQDRFLFIPVLIIGILICIGAVFCMFKGIQTIIRAIFND